MGLRSIVLGLAVAIPRLKWVQHVTTYSVLFRTGRGRITSLRLKQIWGVSRVVKLRSNIGARNHMVASDTEFFSLRLPMHSETD